MVDNLTSAVVDHHSPAHDQTSPLFNAQRLQNTYPDTDIQALEYFQGLYQDCIITARDDKPALQSTIQDLFSFLMGFNTLSGMIETLDTHDQWERQKLQHLFFERAVDAINDYLEKQSNNEDKTVSTETQSGYFYYASQPHPLLKYLQEKHPEKLTDDYKKNRCAEEDITDENRQAIITRFEKSMSTALEGIRSTRQESSIWLYKGISVEAYLSQLEQDQQQVGLLEIKIIQQLYSVNVVVLARNGNPRDHDYHKASAPCTEDPICLLSDGKHFWPIHTSKNHEAIETVQKKAPIDFQTEAASLESLGSYFNCSFEDEDQLTANALFKACAEQLSRLERFSEIQPDDLKEQVMDYIKNNAEKMKEFIATNSHNGQLINRLKTNITLQQRNREQHLDMMHSQLKPFLNELFKKLIDQTIGLTSSSNTTPYERLLFIAIKMDMMVDKLRANKQAPGIRQSFKAQIPHFVQWWGMLDFEKTLALTNHCHATECLIKAEHARLHPCIKPIALLQYKASKEYIVASCQSLIDHYSQESITLELEDVWVLWLNAYYLHDTCLTEAKKLLKLCETYFTSQPNAINTTERLQTLFLELMHHCHHPKELEAVKGFYKNLFPQDGETIQPTSQEMHIDQSINRLKLGWTAMQLAVLHKKSVNFLNGKASVDGPMTWGRLLSHIGHQATHPILCVNPLTQNDQSSSVTQLMDLTQIILSVFEADLPSLDICQQSDKMDFWHDLVKHERYTEIGICITSPTCVDPLILIASTFDVLMNHPFIKKIVNCTERKLESPPQADDLSDGLITTVSNECEAIHLQQFSDTVFAQKTEETLSKNAACNNSTLVFDNEQFKQAVIIECLKACCLQHKLNGSALSDWFPKLREIPLSKQVIFKILLSHLVQINAARHSLYLNQGLIDQLMRQILNIDTAFQERAQCENGWLWDASQSEQAIKDTNQAVETTLAKTFGPEMDLVEAKAAESSTNSSYDVRSAYIERTKAGCQKLAQEQQLTSPERGNTPKTLWGENQKLSGQVSALEKNQQDLEKEKEKDKQNLQDLEKEKQDLEKEKQDLEKEKQDLEKEKEKDKQYRQALEAQLQFMIKTLGATQSNAVPSPNTPPQPMPSQAFASASTAENGQQLPVTNLFDGFVETSTPTAEDDQSAPNTNLFGAPF